MDKPCLACLRPRAPESQEYCDPCRQYLEAEEEYGWELMRLARVRRMERNMS
jgi:hypothetical protein